MSDLVAARFQAISISKDPPVSIEQLPPQVEASDEFLLARVTKGDQLALGVLFQRYSRLLRE